MWFLLIRDCYFLLVEGWNCYFYKLFLKNVYSLFSCGHWSFCSIFSAVCQWPDIGPDFLKFLTLNRELGEVYSVSFNLIDAPGKAKENRFASRVKSKLSVNADLPGPIQPIKLCDPKLWEDSVSTVYSGISQLLQQHRLLSYTAAACLRNEGYWLVCTCSSLVKDQQPFPSLLEGLLRLLKVSGHVPSYKTVDFSHSV